MAKDDKKPEVPKGKDLQALSESINKLFKANVVANMSDADGNEVLNGNSLYKYPTGILSLDKYLGVGGLLGGRVVNIYGWEGTGKTLTALTVAAQVQKTPQEQSPLNLTGFGRVAFLDAEGTFSYSLAKSVGVDTSPDKFLLFRSSPEKILTGEDYFNLINILVQNGIELIIVDSAPAMIPASRLVATVGQGQKATQAQMMAEGLQQVTTLLNAFQRSVVWFINQMRMKPMAMFESPEDHTGGAALRFYASYSVEVKKKEDIIRLIPNGHGGFEDKRIGVSIKAKLKKNKTAVIPVDPIEYDIYFDTVADKDGMQYHAGIDLYKDTVLTGLMVGVIKQTSSWFSWKDIKANGLEAFTAQLRLAGEAAVQQIRMEVLQQQ